MKKYSRIKKWPFYFAVAARLACAPVSAEATLTHTDLTTAFKATPANTNYVLKQSDNAPSFDATLTTAQTEASKPNTTLKKVLGRLHVQTFGLYKQDGTVSRPKAPDDSQGWCARYLRFALEAVGIILPCAPAKDYKTNLPAAGFVEIPRDKYTTPLPGDIVVIDTFENGHVAMATEDGGWVSDFEQLGRWRDDTTDKPLSNAKIISGAWPYKASLQTSAMHFFRHPKLAQRIVPDGRPHWQFTDSSYLASNGNSYNAPATYAYTMPTVKGYLSYMDRQVVTRTLHRQQEEEGLKTLLASLDTPSPVASSEHHIATGETEAALTPAPSAYTVGLLRPAHAPTGAIYPPVPIKRKKKNKALATLLDQWHEARVEVLKRNASLRTGQLDQIAHAKLRRCTLNMLACLPESYDDDIISTFKAARYVFNKLDLFVEKDMTDHKKTVLEQMAERVDEIGRHDAKLGAEAARFIFKNAGKGELRERMRNHALRHATPKP